MGHSQNTTWPTTGSSDDVGIGTTNPFARFHIADGNSTTTGSSVLFEGEIGGTPTSGEGTRLMWIPEKAAFRVGRVSDSFIFQGQTYNLGEGSDFWDDNNIGEFSFATGFNNKASGFGAHSLGVNNKANGDFSFAFGVQNDINANSIGLGFNNTVLSGQNSFAFGSNNTVNGINSTAVGQFNSQQSNNNYSFGLSNNHGAFNNSIALGRSNIINASNTNAFGSSLRTFAEGVTAIGNSNVGIQNSNVAMEFGIGWMGTQKNGLTLFKDGGVQFNELPGTGNALEIDNDGFISRTDNLGGLWTEESATEIYYENDVTIGPTSTNRPQGLKLWVNGSTHTSGFVVNNPISAWFNDPTQRILMSNIANKSIILWGGDDLMGNGGNELQFRFQSNTGSGLTWNNSDGELALSIKNGGTIKGSPSYNQGAVTIRTNHGYIRMGPQNNSYCHIETDKRWFLLNKSLMLRTGILSSAKNTDLQFQTYTEPRVTILHKNGFVGVGVTNPKHLLQVGKKGITSGSHTDAIAAFDGKIVAKNVVTTLTGWADFVFDENYELMPLEELNEFVKTNKHLPEIPTEEEVLENGIDVGEINTKLLQKVEELTLYIIQIEQRMKALENN